MDDSQVVIATGIFVGLSVVAWPVGCNGLDSSWLHVQAIFLGASAISILYIHSRKLTWIPKMMVWKRYLPLNMAIFGIYARFLGCKPFTSGMTSTNLGKLRC